MANGKGLRSRPSYPPRAVAERSSRASRRRRGVRSSGQAAGRFDLGDSAARRGRLGPLHAASEAEFALRAAAHPPRGGQERLLHSRQDRRRLPDQVRALHHQGEPHLRPGLWRLQGRRGPPGGQRRSSHRDVRRERHAEPPPAGPRLCAAGQLLLQRRGERGRPRLVRRRDRHRLQAAGVDHDLLRPRHAAGQRRHGHARGRVSCGTSAAATE